MFMRFYKHTRVRGCGCGLLMHYFNKDLQRRFVNTCRILNPLLIHSPCLNTSQRETLVFLLGNRFGRDNFKAERVQSASRRPGLTVNVLVAMGSSQLARIFAFLLLSLSCSTAGGLTNVTYGLNSVVYNSFTAFKTRRENCLVSVLGDVRFARH